MVNNDNRTKPKQILTTDDDKKIRSFISTLRDYSDNAIRYFRLTKFIRIRGNEYRIDIESSRRVEIDLLIKNKFYIAQEFANKDAYRAYMSDINLPENTSALKKSQNTLQSAKLGFKHNVLLFTTQQTST
ncbi:MAG: AlwI family type II restriction endonuclease [Bifidobacteriaceae bacterium]|jgi:hypothetical protein|nr:AlwI family type II restriction endonuclease [Bifidobacteriaceae bacterium]